VGWLLAKDPTAGGPWCPGIDHRGGEPALLEVSRDGHLSFNCPLNKTPGRGRSRGGGGSRGRFCGHGSGRTGPRAALNVVAVAEEEDYVDAEVPEEFADCVESGK